MTYKQQRSLTYSQNPTRVVNRWIKRLSKDELWVSDNKVQWESLYDGSTIYVGAYEDETRKPDEKVWYVQTDRSVGDEPDVKDIAENVTFKEAMEKVREHRAEHNVSLQYSDKDTLDYLESKDEDELTEEDKEALEWLRRNVKK